MIFYDPLVPVIHSPEDLRTRQYRLGSARYQLLPKQYMALAAQEEFMAFISGYGGGKTKVGAIKSTLLSMHPKNRGLIGMEAATDLEEAAMRDTLDFLYEAELLVEPPNARARKAIVRCIDPVTQENLGYTSEITFAHLDDPKHVRGRHLGWFWIDEGSKVKKEAWQNLIGRLRLPTFKEKYCGFVTGNPEGRNWIYDFFFNDEILTTMTCGRPECLLPDAECNRLMRLKRRAIHCTSYENWFLPPEYITNMVSSYSDEERRRYVEASFDVFEGMIFKEFSEDIHLIPEIIQRAVDSVSR